MPSVNNCDEDVKQERELSLTYLEFYSGVGGWTMAIDEACRKINRRNRYLHRTVLPVSQSPLSSSSEIEVQRQHRQKQEQKQEKKRHPILRLSAKRLAAFDHSDLCNRVLRYNFPDDDDDKANGANRDETKQEHSKHVLSKDSAISSSATGSNHCNGHSNSNNGRGKRGKKRQGTAVRPATVAIERLTRVQLQKFNASIWSMSPPW